MRKLALGLLLLLPLLALALPPRKAFFSHPEISAVTLAPNGASVAWLVEEGTRRAVWLQTLDGAPPRRAMAHTPARELAYTRDGRWLLLAAPTQVFALAVAGQSGSGIVAQLDARSQWRVDTTQAAAIIVSGPLDRRAQRWQIRRLTINGAATLLHEDSQRISGFALAEDGSLRWLQRVENLELVLRHHPSGRERLRCGKLHRCTPMAEIKDKLWLRSNSYDGDPLALARLVRIGADDQLEVMARDPRAEADLDFVATDAAGLPRIAGYQSTVPLLQAIDLRDAAALADLHQAFPGSALRPQLSDGRWLVEERHASRAFVRWHWFDPTTRRVELFLTQSPGEDPKRLAKQPHTWVASDGMRLHGFITMPPGDPRTMPLVVLAHGGPWNHWQPTFNPLAQFVASRGAIVFEPNHRGSTGHGHRYLTAAKGDYGNGRVQKDIDEGARALLARGFGEPKRVAIVGASFGGYAALLGATHAPDLYRAAIAFVPPVDFASTLTWVLRNAESVSLDSVVPMHDWLRMLDLDVEDAKHMARLRSESPLTHVDELRRPVMIVAGGSDERVGIAGIIEYAARAQLAGKDVSVLIDHNAGHRQRNDTAREANFYLLETMLHRHLGMPKPLPLDATVKAYLNANWVSRNAVP